MFNKYSFLQIIIIAFKQIVESLRMRVLPYASCIYCSQGKDGHTYMSVAGGGYRSESGSKACPKSLGSEHRAGPSSVQLCSSYSVSLCPTSLSPGLVLFRGQDGGVGSLEEGLRDPKPAQLLWLVTASTYRCPHCLQDASRTPLCHVQSLWGDAGSSRWAVSGPSAPRGRWREAGAVTLLAARAREAGGTEAAGALAGTPMQTGLTELAGVLLVLTEVSCGPGKRRVGMGWSGH